MKCIKCKSDETNVVDSRVIDSYVKRRRECRTCGTRFNTIETPILSNIIVVKRDGEQRLFDRDKIKRGIYRAFNKMDYSEPKIDALVSEVESIIRDKYNSKVKSSEIGEIVLEKLRSINEVAYIRFASVYKKFDNIDSFLDTINNLKSIKED